MRNVDVSKVNELDERVNDSSVADINHGLKQVLIDPAMVTFPRRCKKKHIEKSKQANMKGNDKICYKSTKTIIKLKTKIIDNRVALHIWP